MGCPLTSAQPVLLNSLEVPFLSAIAKLFRQKTTADLHPFDRRHRVDTGGVLYASQLISGHANDRHSEGYYATAPSLFRGILARWQQSLLTRYALSDYAFVDIGCGKGRALMLAAEYPFRSITGIELNPGLARVARRNLRRSHPGCPPSVITGDALQTPLPSGPLLLFIFNAFTGEVVQAFLQRLSDERLRRSTPIDLLYLHPDHHALVLNTPGVEVIANEEFPFSEEDALADAFGVDKDRCAIYRFSGTLSS